MKKKICCLLLIFLFMLSGCSQKEEDLSVKTVVMTIENYGDVKIELYPQYAPTTVNNFLTLVEEGFYDDNAITRIQKGFVIQFGGEKSLNYTIKGEFKENGFTQNTLSHEKGVISMARGSDNNSASGQAFIVLSDDAKYSLDGKYAAFGKVIEGMDIIEEIENSDQEYQDTTYYFLKNNIKITKITIMDEENSEK